MDEPVSLANLNRLHPVDVADESLGLDAQVRSPDLPEDSWHILFQIRHHLIRNGQVLGSYDKPVFGRRAKDHR